MGIVQQQSWTLVTLLPESLPKLEEALKHRTRLLTMVCTGQTSMYPFVLVTIPVSVTSIQRVQGLVTSCWSYWLWLKGWCSKSPTWWTSCSLPTSHFNWLYLPRSVFSKYTACNFDVVVCSFCRWSPETEWRIILCFWELDNKSPNYSPECL